MTRLRRRCYCNISELPIFYWWRVQETSELSYITKEHLKLNKYRIAGLQEIWDEITDDFLTKFGNDNSSFELKLLETSVLMRRLRYIQGDRKEMTFLEIDLQKLKAIKEKFKSEENDFYDIKARIESVIKHQIDTKTTSVREYYSYIAMIKKDAKNGR